MKQSLFYLLLTLLITSCQEQRIVAGTWIDEPEEKILLHIEEDGGKFWVRIEDRSGMGDRVEVVQKGGTYIAKNSRWELPIDMDADGGSLRFRDVEYIPFSQSRKGRFMGHWKSKATGLSFDVRIDDNIDITWDVLQEGKKPVRFWPKPTDDGFYFTRGSDEWSFTLKEDVMLDMDGHKYEKIYGYLTSPSKGGLSYLNN